MSARNSQRYERHNTCAPCRRAKTRCDRRTPICGRCQRRGPTARCWNEDLEPVRQALDPRTTFRSDESPSDGLRDRPRTRADRSNVFKSWPLSVRDEFRNSSPRATVSWRDHELERHTIPATESLRQLRHLPIIEKLVLQIFTKSPAQCIPRGIAMELLDGLVCQTNLVDDCRSGKLTYHAKYLLRRSVEPISVTPTTTISDFCAQFTGPNLRVETLGLIYGLAAESLTCANYSLDQATNDDLLQDLFACSNICMELTRSLSPDVNDVMLWHTYVNSQLTSSIKGDADLAVWRRIGDLSTDVLGMGLHREETSVCSSIPFFLGQCRRRIFVHTYQLDKFFSTFFNDRPPRLLKQYTTCPVPLDLADDEILTIGASPNAMEEAQRLVTTEGWNKKPIVSSSTWARVRYILGELREELIHLDTSKNAQAQQYKDLLEQCDTRWAAVPDHVKYTPDCWQSDMEHYMCFMFGKVYLTYVHLKMRILQSMVQMLPDMKSDLLRTAADILDIVVQHGSIPDRSRFPKGELSTMILGYGIPCASQWITAMQEPSIEDGLDIPSDIHRGKLIQNLSVFVSHLKNVCQPNEENYDFCVHAHTAISRALDDVLERFALRRPTGHRLDATQGFTSELQDLSQVSTSQVSGEEQYRPESRPFETPDLSQWYSDIDWRTISMDWNVL